MSASLHRGLAHDQGLELAVRKGRQLRSAMAAGAFFVLACLFRVTVVMSKTNNQDQNPGRVIIC